MSRWHILGQPAFVPYTLHWLEPYLQFLSQTWKFITVKWAIEKGPFLLVKCFNHFFTCSWGMNSCLGIVGMTNPQQLTLDRWGWQQFFHHVHLQPGREGHLTPCRTTRRCNGEQSEQPVVVGARLCGIKKVGDSWFPGRLGLVHLNSFIDRQGTKAGTQG